MVSQKHREAVESRGPVNDWLHSTSALIPEVHITENTSNINGVSLLFVAERYASNKCWHADYFQWVFATGFLRFPQIVDFSYMFTMRGNSN